MGGLSDVVLSAIFPLIGALLYIIFGMQISELISQVTSPLLKKGGLASALGWRQLNRNVWPIKLIFLVGGALFMLSTHEDKWIWFPWIIGFPMMPSVVVALQSLRVVRSGIDASILATLLLFGPPMSFSAGHERAMAILEGKKYIYLMHDIGKLAVEKAGVIGSRPRFLGHVGDFNFFFEPRLRAVSIVKEHDDVTVVFGMYSEKKETTLERLLSAPPWEVFEYGLTTGADGHVR